MFDFDWPVYAALGFTLLLIALPVLHRKSFGKVPSIDASQVISMQNSSTPLRLIDLRPVDDFNRSHIQHARSLPFSGIRSSADEVRKLRQATGPDVPIILVCDSDLTSTRLSARLHKSGCENLLVLKGGFNYWKRKRLETAQAQT